MCEKRSTNYKLRIDAVEQRLRRSLDTAQDPATVYENFRIQTWLCEYEETGQCVILDCGSLIFTTLWAISADDQLMIFLLFSLKTEFEMSLIETSCLNCQILFSGKK